MKRTDKYVLYLLYLVLFGAPMVATFYAADGVDHLYVSLIVILTSIGFRYRQDIRREDYAVYKIAGRMWHRSFVWELILIPVVLGLLLGVLEGGERWRSEAWFSAFPYRRDICCLKRESDSTSAGS
ncbi:hypothetical protein OMP38_26545 [Cohnella ginsengisoli]|uniref:Uncharacterized protein n=1 Tax=Cohnella ginsengisoli TaxID=425004 RepID=A0A9X4QP44_9BACL|nr:hypothetical protein [Cohnella ginsengisoli]MDG0793984.1 hypothetical protein [Cohnella ginsengisoli]